MTESLKAPPGLLTLYRPHTTTSSDMSLQSSTAKESVKREIPAHLEQAGHLEETQHGHVSKSLVLTVLWVASASFAFGFSCVST